jgi:D-alanyl-D-alanine carboxypeptidase/D-alanyl-D-alanine-endopeptidase (penicillin-binding protein 4)
MASLRSPLHPLVALVVLAAVGSSGSGGSSALADLTDDVRAAIRAAGLKDATISVSVRDADSSRSLVDVDASRSMIPASNMKVFTSGTAMHVLGPEFRFRTRLLLIRERAGSGENATLVVVGDGDPGFGDPELLASTTWTDRDGTLRSGMSEEQLLSLWTDAVKAAGVTSLREVIVDARVFAREPFHPAWPKDQLNQRSFAEVAGLNFQTNLLGFLPKPGSGPRPDLSDVRPRAPWVTIENKATADTGKKAKQSVWFSRAADSNRFTVHGNVKFASAEPIEVPLNDPPAFFAQLLAHRLRERGVKVGEARTAGANDPAFVDPSSGAMRGEPVGVVIETPLRMALERCNTNSQNLYAEALLKRSGRAVAGTPGSWSNGAEAVKRAVQERVKDGAIGGAPASTLVVSDGSGLSRQNRVSAALVTAWLDTFHRDPKLSSMFVDSLAVGGESGTLRNRFGKLDAGQVTVQCKTGFINGVSCLSGFVTTSDGRRRSFSVLGNNLVQNGAVAKAKKLQEAIVEAIAEDMRGTPALGGN